MTLDKFSQMPRVTVTELAGLSMNGTPRSLAIKFSHDYPKLHGQKTARLIAVEPITIDENTPAELIEYDTRTVAGDYYSLTKGEYIQLIFIGNLRIPFCTIRKKESWLKGKQLDKYEYYKGKIGQTFNIEIKAVAK